MINASIYQDIININLYAPNIGALKCIKQILTDIKGKIDDNNKDRSSNRTGNIVFNHTLD